MVAVALILVSACSKMPSYPQAPFDGKSVSIDIRKLGENKPVFYTFLSGQKKINYFVVRLDNSVQSYFDACAKCFPKRLGYRLDGQEVYCMACDVRYSIHELKDGLGSCYPIKLDGRAEGDLYIINKQSLLQGGKYF
ncbi:MAG: DUF2318 domain-containing protein [Nitrospirae bacterium]|nr:DUF2318 domain-containing protein [Nitrospirota bacterium]